MSSSRTLFFSEQVWQTGLAEGSADMALIFNIGLLALTSCGIPSC